jgi:starch synthase
VGILSGLNEMAWNPERDPALSTSYSAEDPSGKEACRASLRDEVNLPQEEVPVVSAPVLVC